jgi:hypothetical protein
LDQVLRHGTSQILDEVLEANEESSFLFALMYSPLYSAAITTVSKIRNKRWQV